jgi:N-acetylglucosamine kinase-like BadF-type ATPase
VREALAPAAPAETRPAEDLYLGIDGGGTRTVALLARAAATGKGWVVVGRGEAGAANAHAVGIERAQQALDEAVARAFAAAGLPRTTVAAACLGLAGAGRPEDQAPVRDWAGRARLAGVVDVSGDTPLLLAAGTPEGWGVAVVAGTGSMAFARAKDGRTARAGGWGYLLGDEGSGYALAVAGLQAAARAADGRGPATTLTARLLAALGVRQPQELIAAVYRSGLDRTALAALAPVVLTAAEEGDAEAGALIAEAARQLAVAAAAAARALGLEPSAVPIALAGGLLRASPSYRARVLDSLTGLGYRAAPVAVVREPAEGALRLAVALSRPRNS